MNLSMQNLFLVVLLLPLFLWGEREYTDEQIAFWEDEAYPVLEENCWSCHGVSKKNTRRFNSYHIRRCSKRRRIWACGGFRKS